MEKTPDQIKTWLESQDWHGAFKANVKGRHPDEPAIRRRILNGLYGANTLLGAFEWANTAQGMKFWESKHAEFLQWFKQKEKKLTT